MTQDLKPRSSNPLERSRQVGTELSIAARHARSSPPSRIALYKTVGLRPRTSDRVFAALETAAFVVGFVVPLLLAVVYYGFIASDQYVSEARFTVRTSAPMRSKDSLTKANGIPSAKIVQDTQIVTDNVETLAMVDWLDQRLDLRAIFARDDVDYFSRLAADAPREDLRDYWQDMVDATVTLPGGIITITVRSFDPEHSKAILDAMIERSEDLVNELNDRIWGDAQRAAATSLEQSTLSLQAARVALREEQNARGVFDVEQEAESFAELIEEVQTELLQLEARFASNLVTVSADAPQMRVLQGDIDAKRSQLDELRARVARSGGGASGSDESLADVSAEASRLQFELDLAEDTFAENVKTVERLRLLSGTQLMYLDPFLAPTLPESAEYPRRVLMIAVVAVLAFLAWMLMTVVINKVRLRYD